MLFCSFLMPSCAQKVDSEFGGEAVIFQSQSEEREHYSSCNFFADETFRGYIWHDSEGAGYAPDCVNLDIVKSPKEFLRNEDLFLQIYPFSTDDEELKYGASLPIRTIKKNEDKEVLVLSQIIDTYLVETELQQDTDYFFLDHSFEVCNVGKEWEGLQLVIYERRAEQENAVPIRISKFLLPPFLVHPEHFRETKGSALAAFHPFLEHIPELKSEPSAYYDLAEQMCDQLF